MARPVGDMVPYTVTGQRCTALTATGQPCKNKAIRRDRCGVHALGGWRVSDSRDYPVTITRVDIGATVTSTGNRAAAGDNSRTAG